MLRKLVNWKERVGAEMGDHIKVENARLEMLGLRTKRIVKWDDVRPGLFVPKGLEQWPDDHEEAPAFPFVDRWYDIPNDGLPEVWLDEWCAEVRTYCPFSAPSHH